MSELAYDIHTPQNERPCFDESKANNADNSQQFNLGDKAVIQLLRKLDEGTQTLANLRSILTLKTAELNELVAQLELTNQAIMNVESTTAQIESMLKDLGLSGDPQTLLMDAEASLDSAFKTASKLYAPTSQKTHARRQSVASNANNGGDQEQRLPSVRLVSRIRYKPDTKHILRQINEQLQELELDPAKFFESMGSTDDVESLQKAKVDLDIAKTIALSTKSSMKRRTLLLRSVRRRNNLEEIKTLGTKIRESVDMWKTYVRDAPLLIDGMDILTLLDHEDDLISRNLPVHPSRISYDGFGKGSPTPSTSTTSRNIRNSLSARSTDSSASGKHSRTPSIAGDSAIPVPIFTVPTPSANDSAGATNVKKHQRHSVTARPAVKVIPTARARTSSLTGNRASSAAKLAKTKETQSMANPTSSTHAGQTVTNTAATLPPATSIPVPSAPVNTDVKKSGLKPPTQLGPGSTLRIRSMLAKRNLQQKPMD